MASLLQVGLGNAAAATALALIAAGVCLLLRGRRPAVAHAVWLLVLLKLLTPPVRTIPVRWLAGSAPASPVMAPPEAHPPTDGIATVFTSIGPDEPDVEAEPEGVTAIIQDSTAPVVVDEPLTRPPVLRRWLPATLGSIWLAGSIGCLALVAFRSRRFRRLMRHATPAPADVRRRAAELARLLGAGDSRGPDVWFVPGAVCPMLWAPLARPARLLLPGGLWNELTAVQRDTLIVHELAHLRRRDHWVRLVEVAATVLYWWLPVVWWARRRLREAEEQCCDAWVVWSMPRCTRHYMTAILQAVEFVSEGFVVSETFVGARAAVAVPPTACGMAAGDFRQLKRRLTMIRENETDRRHAAGRTLGRTGLGALCAAAAALLPLAPSLAQVESPPVTVEIAPAQTSAAVGAAPAPETAVVGAAPAPETAVVGAAPAPETAAVGAASAPEAAPRPVKVGASVELRSNGDTAPSAENAPPDGVVAQIRPSGTVVVRPRIDATRSGTAFRSPELAEIRLDPAPVSTVDDARAEVERLSRELDQAKARLADMEQGRIAARTPTAVRGYRLTQRAAPNNRTSAARASNADPSQGDSNRRLDELERKLDRLLGEVERLKENRQGANHGPSPATSSLH